jgi:apolipoprotein N-acyltransferase
VIEGRWARRGVALVAGLAICASMPPWGWWPLAPLAIGGWALLLDRPRWRDRFWIGALVGAGWFLPSTLWMVKFSPVGWPVGVAIWFPFVMGVASALCPPTAGRFLALPATLIASEWVRWHAPFGGVPLSMLAMTQGRGPLLASARIGGSLLVSAGGAVAGSGIGALAARHLRLGSALLAGVVVVAALGVVAPAGHATSTLRVAAVQGGGPQETRSENTDYSVVFARHLRASDRIRTPVDLVVWPENVVNVGRYEGSYEQGQLGLLARRLHATVVAGVVEAGPDDEHFLNQAVAIDPDGREVDRYEKVRRVPFGEYVPLRNLLDPIAHDILPPKDQIPGTKPDVLSTAAGRLGVVVSWEVFFGRRVREAIHHHAEIVLNPTNGSSYWLTQVQSQQIASSQLRAVESGRWLVQAAPTGFSAIVSPSGDVVARSGIGSPAVLQRAVQLRDGDTIASVLGDLPALVLAAGLVASAWVGLLRRRRGVSVHRRGATELEHLPSKSSDRGDHSPRYHLDTQD